MTWRNHETIGKVNKVWTKTPQEMLDYILMVDEENEEFFDDDEEEVGGGADERTQQPRPDIAQVEGRIFFLPVSSEAQTYLK